MKNTDETFSSALKQFVYLSDFPARKHAGIVRVKLRVAGADIEDRGKLQETFDDV